MCQVLFFCELSSYILRKPAKVKSYLLPPSLQEHNRFIKCPLFRPIRSPFGSLQFSRGKKGPLSHNSGHRERNNLYKGRNIFNNIWFFLLENGSYQFWIMFRFCTPIQIQSLCRKGRIVFMGKCTFHPTKSVSPEVLLPISSPPLLPYITLRWGMVAGVKKRGSKDGMGRKWGLKIDARI